MNDLLSSRTISCPSKKMWSNTAWVGEIHILSYYKSIGLVGLRGKGSVDNQTLFDCLRVEVVRSRASDGLPIRNVAKSWIHVHSVSLTRGTRLFKHFLVT